MESHLQPFVSKSRLPYPQFQHAWVHLPGVTGPTRTSAFPGPLPASHQLHTSFLGLHASHLLPLATPEILISTNIAPANRALENAFVNNTFGSYLNFRSAVGFFLEVADERVLEAIHTSAITRRTVTDMISQATDCA